MDVDQLFLEAVAAHRRDERGRARDIYEVIVTHSPSHGSARYNLSILLLQDSQWLAALDHLDLLLETYPKHAGAHYSRGRALARLGRYAEARAALTRAAALEPNDPETQLALGNVCSELGRRDEARLAYERVVALAPKNPAGYLSLGRLCVEAAKFAEAKAIVTRGLAIAPDAPQLHFLLGQALIRLREFEASKRALEQAVRLAPGFMLARSYLMRAARFAGDWAVEEQCFAELRKVLGRGNTAEFLMPAPQALYFPFTRHEQLQIALRHARRVEARAVRAPVRVRLPRPDGRPLRVGYLSADFRNSATLHLAIDVLEAHDRAAVDVAMYALATDDSTWGRRARGAARLFRDLSQTSTADAVAQIADDDIDILVDLNVYTQFTRPEIPASRPAPLVAHWLSVSGTAGASWFDYVIADRTVAPAEHFTDYAEACVWLPHCYQPNRRLDDTRPATRAALGLPASGVVFCVFNSQRKLDRLTFESWLRILRQVPDGVLWLLDAPAEKRRRLADHAQGFGVAPERLIYAPNLPHAEHLPRFGGADLFLDSLIHGAHTTASDALRMGVPVLTVTGETFAARVATSLLRTAGLDRLAFATVTEFEAQAVALAHDPMKLARLKAEVAAKVRASPLFDPVRFARNLENGYREMWRRHQAGLAPQPFAVEEITGQ
jgi:predicted O-linked N-acetylglucosamine transferase (SPINDLY family)